MKIEFKELLNESEEIKLDVRNWRNQESVRKYMYTDHMISEIEHKRWLESLSDNKRNLVYVVYINDLAEGIVSVNAINERHKTAEWAFYLADENKRGGTGALIEYEILNHIFEKMEIEKLNCEVLETNPAVIKLHQKFGFSLEGIRRKNILKEEKRIDVHLLGITKEEWKTEKIKLEKVIGRLKS